MIPYPKLPIFIYSSLCSPFKLVALAGKIEGSMKANLSQYKQVESGKIALTGNNNDQTQGELLWLNLKNYDQIIDSLDEYGKLDETQSYERFSCEPITNEPPYRAITPTLVRAWSYKII